MDQAEERFRGYTDEALESRRRKCIEQLGPRALCNGGSYRMSPTVLTPEFCAKLRRKNARRRKQDYPMLNKLLGLLAKIDAMANADARELPEGMDLRPVPTGEVRLAAVADRVPAEPISLCVRRSLTDTAA